MKIVSMEVDGFRGAPDGRYDFADEAGSPMTVVWLRGGPRAGKTSLLAAVACARSACAPMGAPLPTATLLKAGRRRGRILVVWRLPAEEREPAAGEDSSLDVTTQIEIDEARVVVSCPRELKKRWSRFSSDKATSKLAWFDEALSTRRARTGPRPTDLAQCGAGGVDSFEWVAGVLAERLQAAADETDRALVEKGLLTAADRIDHLVSFREALAALAPDLALGPVRRVEGKPVPSFASRGGAALAYDDLSATERAMVVWAGAYAILGLERSLTLLDAPWLALPEAARAERLVAWAQLMRAGQTLLTGAGAPPPALLAKTLDLTEQP